MFWALWNFYTITLSSKPAMHENNSLGTPPCKMHSKNIVRPTGGYSKN